jgi:PAS domain S-box-containing protein
VASPLPGPYQQNSSREVTSPNIAESELRNSLALEAAGVGTWSWELATNVVAGDCRCKALFGMPENTPDITCDEFFLHVYPDDRQLTKSAIKRFLETRSEYDLIHRVVWPDGSVHWLRCKGRRANNGEAVTRVIGVAVDVTWLKRSEEKHIETEDRLQREQKELERRVRESTAELERTASQVAAQARLLDLANDAIFVRTADDKISYWNEGAERLYGWTKEEAVGKSPHDLLATEFPVPFSQISECERWEGELRHRKRDGSKIIVASRWTRLCDDEGNPEGWLEINTDITPRKRAEEAAQRLSGRILSVQDTERRKMARELHDGLGQYLTCLKIDIGSLSSDAPDRENARAERLAECLEIVDKCLAETRTLSYLLHPPLLDETGLISAVRWYVEGFVKRSGIEANVKLPPGLPRLRSDMELALFRVIQECLTNVHRHSRCSLVNVSIELDEQITLRIKDNGCGIPQDRLGRFRESSAEMGIGLAGMRERVRDLGGRLELHSDSSGTTVTATMPVALRVSESDEQSSSSEAASAS